MQKNIDLIEFMEKMQVPCPKNGTVPFKLHPYQKELVKQFERMRMRESEEPASLKEHMKEFINRKRKNSQWLQQLVVHKSRQIGMTTLFAAYAAALCESIPGVEVGIMSGRGAKHRLNNIIDSNCNDSIRMQTLGTKRFKNGSYLCILNPSVHSGCSQAFDVLLFDECGYYSDNIRLAMIPSLISSKMSLAVYASTGGTSGSVFSNMLTHAKAGGATLVRLPYDVVPGRQGDWLKEQINRFGIENVERELTLQG
jgi:hypothetical protein